MRQLAYVTIDEFGANEFIVPVGAVFIGAHKLIILPDETYTPRWRAFYHYDSEETNTETRIIHFTEQNGQWPDNAEYFDYLKEPAFGMGEYDRICFMAVEPPAS